MCSAVGESIKSPHIFVLWVALFRSNPFLQFRVIFLDELCWVSCNDTKCRKTPSNNCIRADDTVLSQRQFAFATKNNAVVTEPAVAANDDPAAFRHPLRADGTSRVRIFVVMVHDQDGRGEQNIIAKLDVVSGGDCRPPADLASTS